MSRLNNMRTRHRMIAVTATTIVVVAVCVVIFRLNDASPNDVEVSVADDPAFFAFPSFETNLRSIEAESFVDTATADLLWSRALRDVTSTNDGKIVAGIVNHHALAGDKIASFFARLRISRPELRRIVIIAPDHFSAGRDEVSTSLRPYHVGSATVSVDEDTVHRLVLGGVASEEEGSLFEREHGIGALAPFVVRAYPEVKIVPIVFRGSVSRERMSELSRALVSLWDEETVIVISADMSHYLVSSQALENDKTTLRLLETKDVDIASSTDDYLDSGKSVATLFTAMASVHPRATFTLFDHAISSDYGADPSNATSYMTGGWEEARSER